MKLKMQSEKKKSSAGRPPKNLTRKLENRKGIHAEPVDPRNYFELHHDNIDIFKFLFESCKRFKDSLEFIVHPEGVRFCFSTPGKKSVCVADLMGKRVVRFFCSQERSYKCRVEDLVKALKLKKSCDKIRFAISMDNIYKLSIAFYAGDKRKQDWSIDLDPEEKEDLTMYENLYNGVDNYPLSFNTSWSEFKDAISSWKQFTSDGNVIFEMDEELKIYFSEGAVSCICYDSHTEVKYTGQDLFALSIPIISLISVSASSVLAENLKIYLKEESSAIMVAKLDESFKTKKEAIPDTETILIKFFISVCD
jgi:hypothetical protein